MVRQLITEALQIHGYKVLAAFNGDEALRLFEQHQGPIHLMLTDVVMPKMSRQELVMRLALLHPEMKVLYMSAYAEDIIGHRRVLEQRDRFYSKALHPRYATADSTSNNKPPVSQLTGSNKLSSPPSVILSTAKTITFSRVTILHVDQDSRPKRFCYSLSVWFMPGLQ